jgi:capsular exopolysaccharide synthesis family protein
MDTRTLLLVLVRSLFARRKKWIVLTMLASLALLVPAAYLLSKEPPRYQTVATVLIENKADRAPVFQEFSPYRPLPVQLAILQSRLLAASVVEALPRPAIDDLVYRPYGRDYWGEFQDWLHHLRGKESPVASPQRRAVGELQHSRVRFVPQNSGIVEIQADASQPQIALDIANTYIEVLLARTHSFNVDDAKSTREYLARQTAQTSDALGRSEAALRAFTMSRGGVQIPAKSIETAQRVSQLETTLVEVQANKSISQTRLAGMKAKVESMPVVQASIPPVKMVAPPVSAANAGRLRNKLASLEAQMVEAKSRYGEDHVRVRSLAQQIADVQRDLSDAIKDSTVASSSTNSVPSEDRAAFVEMVGALETSVVSLTAQENALKEQLAVARRDLSGLSKDELEYRRLASDVETNRKLSTLLSDKLGAARIREQGEMNVVKVIDPPSYPSTAPNQRRMQFLGLALVLSLVIGLGAPATAEYFNRPIMSESDVRHLTGLPILAAIPEVQKPGAILGPNGSQNHASQEEYHLFVDAFRRLRVELQMLGDETPLRRILVASALPFEGKSTVTFNLGLAFGEMGKRVIIADADFHRPTLHRLADSTPRKGFTDLLAGTSSLTETITPITEHVQLAPRGGSLTASARTGLGNRLSLILSNMSDETDYVLMDSSPILLIPDNLYIAAAADGIVLVVSVGTTRPRDLVRTKEILERAGTPIVGVVLNRTPIKQLNAYYKQYSRYYSA